MPVPLIRTPKVTREIVSDYFAGLSFKEMEAKYGVKTQHIYRVLAREGVKCDRRTKESNNRRSEYVIVYAPDHPNASATSGQVKEHTLIASRVLGRPLKEGEVVHHINGNKKDNRNCNLLICDKKYHSWLHQEMSRRYQKEHFGSL